MEQRVALLACSTPRMVVVVCYVVIVADMAAERGRPIEVVEMQESLCVWLVDSTAWRILERESRIALERGRKSRPKRGTVDEALYRIQIGMSDAGGVEVEKRFGAAKTGQAANWYDLRS